MNIKKSTLMLLLLKEFLEGKKVSLKEFALKYDINIRTAQRYMEDIEEVFQDNLVKESELYSFITSSILENNILNFNKYELEVLVDLYSLLSFDFSQKLDENSQKLIKKLEKNYSKTYLIKQNPFENLSSKKEIIHEIKKAINQSRYTKIEYESDKLYVFEDVKILKIVFTEGNFYLAIVTDDEINNGFKFLRLNFVKNVTLLKNSFKKDYEAIYFLDSFQTLFSNYKEKSYEVIVQVDISVKRYFLNKKFLSSQEIIENKDDLILKFQVTNDMEILPLIKKWLPNIKILSPESTKNRLKDDLIKYLKESILEKGKCEFYAEI